MPGDHREEYLNKEVEKSKYASKIYEDTKKALLSEERFINFFKSYHPQSVNSFIEYYASQKAYWHLNADSLMKFRKSKNNHWRNIAINSFRQIFIKKLFDLKCRWVAGEIDLPGIEISADFEKWHYDPASCDCLEPITPDEMNCYLTFLDQPAPARENDEDDDEDVSPSYITLNHYHWHKSISMDPVDEKKYTPYWFRYYDKQFGTSTLRELPNTRMDIETDDNDIWTEHILKKTLTEEQLKNFTHLNRNERKELRENPEKLEAYYEEQNRKYAEIEKTRPKYVHMSVYDRIKMEELVSLIELPEVQKLYRASREWSNRRNRNEMIESTLIYLKEVKEWVPVESNDDYREGIKNAYSHYSDQMLKEMLPLIFEEYRLCIEKKKKFNWNTDESDSMPGGSSAEIRKRLLAARKWKSEPENFDFLKKENLPKN